MAGREIAKAQKIPARFLEQVLLTLRKNKILQSTRGRDGGYRLAREPRKITLLEVIEALEGPLVFSPLFSELKKLEKSIAGILARTTLETLIKEQMKKNRIFIYNI